MASYSACNWPVWRDLNPRPIAYILGAQPAILQAAL